jgi:hypothetical protein
LDNLVARIDAPLLKRLGITFFNQILFDTPQLVQFISRISALKAPEKANIVLWNSSVTIDLSPRVFDYRYLNVRILCETPDWQVSSLEQVCTWCFPPLSTLEDLYICGDPFPRSNWQSNLANLENRLWLELLRPFTAVKNLYLSKEFGLRIIPSLEELVGERTAELLPALQDIFMESLDTSDPVQKAIQQFVSTRQASQPIAVSHWDGREKYVFR